jgi:hypothetical protein
VSPVGKRRAGLKLLRPQRQRKARMVKARLLESQSSWPQRWQRRRVVATPFWSVPLSRFSVRVLSRSSMPSVGGMKGTTKRPNRAASLLRRKCGIAWAGAEEGSHLYGNGVAVLPCGPVMGTAAGARGCRIDMGISAIGNDPRTPHCLRGRATATIATNDSNTRVC